MEIDERRRHRLGTDARRVLGEESGTTLMELLPPVGWADVATKQDLAALEQRLGLRFALVDERFAAMEQRTDERFTALEQGFDGRFTSLAQRFDAKLEAVELRLEARMERGFRQVLVTVSALVVSGFAASIVASLAR